MLTERPERRTRNTVDGIIKGVTATLWFAMWAGGLIYFLTHI